jgi:hypothetical protein
VTYHHRYTRVTDAGLSAHPIAPCVHVGNPAGGEVIQDLARVLPGKLIVVHLQQQQAQQQQQQQQQQHKVVKSVEYASGTLGVVSTISHGPFTGAA